MPNLKVCDFYKPLFFCEIYLETTGSIEDWILLVVLIIEERQG